jgi:dihydroxy-acid dehydratase
MGGISANKPIVHLVTGPMMPGSYKGARIGACTDCRNNWAKFRAGTIDVEDISAINDELAPTVTKTKVSSNRTLNNILKAGTCGVMGTASTMACILVALGMMPFKGATAPAVSSARLRIAEESGKLAVDAAATRRVPQALLSRESFLNAMTVLQAIGGSTNAVVHLMAIIGRHPTVAGTIDLSTFDDIGRRTPLLVDLKPSGKNYMTDFHNSGGMLALLHALKPLLYLDVMTVSGKSLGEEIDSAPYARVPRSSPTNCLHSLADPLYPASSLVVLRGNLAPGGAVMKASASKDRTLLQHSGRAVVFANSADLAARIDDPELDVDADSVLVLQNIGPVGNPGMPEAGLIPIPRKLSEKGVEDMLRLSDGRMSGTAGGTIVLHISPESSNPDSVLGVVQNGDMIECDVEKRLLHLRVSDEEIEQRIASRKLKLEATVTASATQTRGYRGLYMRTVNQAQQGADFDFLTAAGPT